MLRMATLYPHDPSYAACAMGPDSADCLPHTRSRCESSESSSGSYAASVDDVACDSRAMRRGLSLNMCRLIAGSRLAYMFFAAGIHVALKAILWRVQREQEFNDWIGGTVSTTVALACCLSFSCLRTDSSRLGRQAELTLYLLWITSETIAAGVLSELLPGNKPWRRHFMGALADASIAGTDWAGQGATQCRIELVEVAFGSQLCSRNIYYARWVCLVPSVLLCMLNSSLALTNACFDSSGASVSKYLGAVRCFAGVVSWAAVGTLSWRGLSKMRRAATLPPRVGAAHASYLTSESAWARDVIYRVRSCILLNSLQYVFVKAWFGTFQVMLLCGFFVAWFVDSRGAAVINSMSTCMEFMTLLVMVGFFRPEMPDMAFGIIPSERTSVISPTVKSSVWANKVQDMANRSIDVETLLDFFKYICANAEVLDYDPLRHTTNDVVRKFVIPLSRLEHGGVAYALAAPHDAPPRPERMVTHSWSNLFHHLVAAVVADALALDDYNSVAEALLTTEKLAKLWGDIQDAGALHTRYWICAFCVNQHASICGGFGPEPLPGTRTHENWERGRRDSVTGLVFQTCPCAEPKHFNESPEECELNKFDDMMRLLNDSVVNFQQVVAVDREYKLFSRAWCVAELVQAHRSRMSQRVMLVSAGDLAFHAQDLTVYEKLINLTVTECEASRPEDKEYILSRIPDVEEFDTQLQAAIFGTRGLFGQRFSGFDALNAAANTARRLLRVRRVEAAKEKR